MIFICDIVLLYFYFTIKLKLAKTERHMKQMVHSRFLCMITIISILVLGIYCEDIHTDSSFSYSEEMGSAFLQPVRSVSDTDNYCERNSLSVIENFVIFQQSVRNLSFHRLCQLFTLVLLVIGTYQFLFSFRNSFLHTDAYANQYQHRTLEYIHHNDGKKA